MLKAAVKELKEKRIIVTQCDEIEEWRPSQRDRISFLGEPTGLDRTINVIQRRTGAEVVFGVLHRYSLENYKLIMYGYDEMIHILGGSFAAASVGETVLKFLERYIYAHPEQWYQWKHYFSIAPPEASSGEVGTRNAFVPVLEPQLSRPPEPVPVP